MAAPVIVPLAEADIPAAALLAARAFNRDPAFVFPIPDAAKRLRLTTPLFAAILRAYLPHDGVFATQGDLEGIAIGLPPGGEVADAEMAAAGFGQVVEAWGAEIFAPLGSFLEALHVTRMRLMPMPHWYLLILAVEPARQRQGIGGAMLRHIQSLAAAAGVPFYLETDVPGNVGYYEGHGFRVVEQWPVPAMDGAPTWGMCWDPER